MENKWLSDFEIIQNLEHIPKQIKFRKYVSMKFLERCDYFCYFNHTQFKKGLKNGKYFFEEDKFIFKPFLTYKHFVCVLKYGNIIEYFDSKGDKSSNSNRLKKLLKNKNYKLKSNKTVLQTNNYSCGRYVLLRCLMYFNDLKTFINILNEIKNKMKLNDYDETVDYILFNYYAIKF
jgi:hypothetical protein